MTSSEILLLSLIISCFILIVISIVVMAVIDCRYQKQMFNERYKIERELKLLGFWWNRNG